MMTEMDDLCSSWTLLISFKLCGWRWAARYLVSLGRHVFTNRKYGSRASYDMTIGVVQDAIMRGVI